MPITQPKRIYLASPEVFFLAGEHLSIVAEKKRLLREYGFEVGYMIGQGKRTTNRDELGHTVEDFELSDNLMSEGARLRLNQAHFKPCSMPYPNSAGWNGLVSARPVVMLLKRSIA